MICSGILVGGKKCEVRAWTKQMKSKGETATPQKSTREQMANRALMGRWKAGVPNTNATRPAWEVPREQIPTPMEPAAMRQGGHTQGGGTTTGVGLRGNAGGGPRERMLSIVRCYRCGLMGHLQYTCTSPSRRAAARVENGRGILPMPTHVSANQNGKCPAPELPQDAKKPAVADGSKYGKPYWLAELEKVKKKWGTGIDMDKGRGVRQGSVGNPGQGDSSNVGKAPLWMGTGKGGFVNINGHGDGRIVELGPDGEPVDK